MLLDPLYNYISLWMTPIRGEGGLVRVALPPHVPIGIVHLAGGLKEFGRKYFDEGLFYQQGAYLTDSERFSLFAEGNMGGYNQSTGAGIERCRQSRQPTVGSSTESSMPPLAIDPTDPSLGGNLIGGDPHTYHPALWDYLRDEFDVKSVLDLGCGEGHCVRYFNEAGVKAIGVDGLKQNIERAVAPIELHDLRHGPYTLPVDLVHCCEVVEHIDAIYLDNLLRTLANGAVIAMTHALPGQPGHHHVNCQSADYWIGKLEALGYEFLKRQTQAGKDRIAATGSWTYFIQSGLILRRKER
jgi:SAM-dependent methyltransferase